MNALPLALAMGALILVPLTAQDEKKLTPAEELLKATRFEENGQEAAEAAFKPVIEQFKKQGLPPEAIKEIESAASAYFHQLMSDPALKKGVIDLYNEIFEEDELVELLLFYKTPTGRKALMEMPKIFGAAMQLGQKHAEKYAPQFQGQLEKILKKDQDGVDPEKKDK
jgi:hypothetical protein